MIHLTLFVGQLACSVTGSGIDHCRRHYFRIARFACLVQEEVDERTLELCAFSFIYRKARTRDFNTQVKVYQIVFLGQFPVWKRIFGKFGFHAAHFFNHIVVGAYTFGYAVVRNIGNCIEQVLQVGCSLVHFFLQCLVGFFQFGYTVFGSLCLVFLALFHQHSDRFGQGIDFRQVLI